MLRPVSNRKTVKLSFFEYEAFATAWVGKENKDESVFLTDDVHVQAHIISLIFKVSLGLT